MGVRLPLKDLSANNAICAPVCLARSNSKRGRPQIYEVLSAPLRWFRGRRGAQTIPQALSKPETASGLATQHCDRCMNIILIGAIKDCTLHFLIAPRGISYFASVTRKKRSVLGGLGPFRDNMCTRLTALAALRYAPDSKGFRERQWRCSRNALRRSAPTLVLRAASRQFAAGRRRPGETMPRSSQSNPHCTSNASSAAGIAPASNNALSFNARPAAIRSP